MSLNFKALVDKFAEKKVLGWVCVEPDREDELNNNFAILNFFPISILFYLKLIRKKATWDKLTTQKMKKISSQHETLTNSADMFK
jgi:hypothetical protein